MTVPKMTITNILSGAELPEESTMLTEALVAWDHMDPRGMHTERFMLAYLAERRDPDNPQHCSLSLSGLAELPPEAQQAPASLMRAIAGAPVEKLRTFRPSDEEPGHRTVGLAFFVHTWCLTGQPLADLQAGRYMGKPQDHPQRQRARLMAAHYRGHTVTLARTEHSSMPLPLPADQFGPLLPALEAASSALEAATRGEPA